MKKSLIVLFCLAVLGGFFVYGRQQIYFSKGRNSEGAVLAIEKGDKVTVVAAKLSQKELISNKVYFIYYYALNHNILSRIDELKAGNYQIPAGATIPEIAKIVSQANLGAQQIKITFPEGWTAKEMAQRFDENGLPGAEVLKIAQNPSDELKQTFGFLAALPKSATLEGYLFPDTYFFSQDSSAQDIIVKMLQNFDNKVASKVAEQPEGRQKSLHEFVIMASIVEGEVPSARDAKIVSGLFWKRLEIGMMLQSDATLEYVLDTNKKQHSLAETQLDSPYNTYRVKGLPPGPVNNPGLIAIEAALNPQASDYLFFLSDTETGETIFSRTFEEHVANKAKYGL